MAERLEDLYAELHAPIFRFLAALTGDPDAAEALTQETFLQAILALPRFRRESSSTTWLYAIARNVNRKHMAKGRRPRPDGRTRTEPFRPCRRAPLSTSCPIYRAGTVTYFTVRGCQAPSRML
ncbi:RNA polymerase sigma factor [Symbiobacterium terraclitae]|uniref:RNA polymerase sigma factor n=1 Tax=Symbiobacterium terraclitae TaxID=557451 RepID=UPI0035B53047